MRDEERRFLFDVINCVFAYVFPSWQVFFQGDRVL